MPRPPYHVVNKNAVMQQLPFNCESCGLIGKRATGLRVDQNNTSLCSDQSDWSIKVLRIRKLRIAWFSLKRRFKFKLHPHLARIGASGDLTPLKRTQQDFSS
jgi:hypothetical protein